MTNSATLTPEQATIACRQIGGMNILAISGGRKAIHPDFGLVLPVRYGYKVEVALAADDTYTVRRVHVRAGVRRVHGEVTGVYAEQVGDTAYRASCYSDGKFGA